VEIVVAFTDNRRFGEMSRDLKRSDFATGFVYLTLQHALESFTVDFKNTYSSFPYRSGPTFDLTGVADLKPVIDQIPEGVIPDQSRQQLSPPAQRPWG
jgi:hypothetical protein